MTIAVLLLLTAAMSSRLILPADQSKLQIPPAATVFGH
ncbi:hypothetical protein BFJ66_g16895 [Fusarium oxysporum f. sp. cepae]|nr:hypothetical protein BFJ66_g16895 [Fusarium oxysporum f. sp. cepae]